MDEAVIVALVGLAGSALGSLCGVLVNTKLSNYRIEQLEKKVEKHNHIVERTFLLEGRMNEAEHDIQEMKGGEK